MDICTYLGCEDLSHPTCHPTRTEHARRSAGPIADAPRDAGRSRRDRGVERDGGAAAPGLRRLRCDAGRSEERRVGREWRSRGPRVPWKVAYGREGRWASEAD